MTVVGERVPHVAQLAGRLALAVQLRIGIGLRLVRLVAASLPLEVPTTAGIVVTVLAHEALVSGPGLDQRAVDAEVLTRQQVPGLGRLQHFAEERDHRVVLDQALAVLAEHCRHPHRVVRRQA